MFTARRQHDLPVERVRSRVGAYIYGNILVLAAIFATSPQSIAHWSAVFIVVATSASTFLAHVVAHNTGQAIGRRDHETLRLHLTQEARDAVPIINSGAGPVLFLALVHLQDRFRTVSYGKSYETSYLCTFVFGEGARAARNRIALQRRFHFAPFADAPGEFEGG